MWPRQSCILAEKGRKLLSDDALESYFKEIMRMVSAETLLSYPYRKLPLTVHTDELIDDIEGIKIYIDDILVLSKYSFKFI